MAALRTRTLLVRVNHLAHPAVAQSAKYFLSGCSGPLQLWHVMGANARASHRRGLRSACANAPVVNGRHLTCLDSAQFAGAAPTELTAGDVMDRQITTAKADEQRGVVVERMARREADCAIVHLDGKVVGVLRKHDLLRTWLASNQRRIPSVAPATASQCSSRQERAELHFWVGYSELPSGSTASRPLDGTRRPIALGATFLVKRMDGERRPEDPRLMPLSRRLDMLCSWRGS